MSDASHCGTSEESGCVFSVLSHEEAENSSNAPLSSSRLSQPGSLSPSVCYVLQAPGCLERALLAVLRYVGVCLMPGTESWSWFILPSAFAFLTLLVPVLPLQPSVQLTLIAAEVNAADKSSLFFSHIRTQMSFSAKLFCVWPAPAFPGAGDFQRRWLCACLCWVARWFLQLSLLEQPCPLPCRPRPTFAEDTRLAEVFFPQCSWRH